MSKTKAFEGLSRLSNLVEINMPKISKNTISDFIEDFCRGLAILNSEDRLNYSMPKIYDDIWHLSLQDNDFYCFVCWYAVYEYGKKEEKEPFSISHDPLKSGSGTLEQRRRTFRKMFIKLHSRDLIDPTDTTTLKKDHKKRKNSQQENVGYINNQDKRQKLKPSEEETHKS